VRDERALLSALQICLAMLQDPTHADDEVGGRAMPVAQKPSSLQVKGV
jgi:hypothetical protein